METISAAQTIINAARECGLAFRLDGAQLRLHGDKLVAERYKRRYNDALQRYATEIVALIRRSDEATQFVERLQREAEDNVPDWLEYAAWCLIYDAMQAYIKYGNESPEREKTRAAIQRGHTHAELREIILEHWSAIHRAMEKHRYSRRWGVPPSAEWEQCREELSAETELWVMRLLSLEFTSASTLNQINVSVWTAYLHKNGRRLGLAWNDYNNAPTQRDG